MDEDVVEIENVENVCRLCLCTDEPRASVFGTDKQEEDSTAVPLAIKIQACLSIEISPTDKLSTLICEECVKSVNQWHTYRESCLRSQNKLQKWLTSHSKPEVVTIKGEPVDLDYEDHVEIISEVNKKQKSLNIPIHTVEEEGSETSDEQIQNVSDHVDEDEDGANNTEQQIEPETVPLMAEKETDKDESQRTEEQQQDPLSRPIKSEPLDDYDTDCTVELESAEDNELLLNPMALGGTKEDVVMEADSTQKSTGGAGGATHKKKLRRGPHTHFRGPRAFKQNNKNNGTENSESQNEEEEMVEDLEEELISMEKESPLTQVQQDIISQLKTFSCYKCQQSFNDRRSTLSHIRQHLPDLRPHTCIACLTQFSDRSMYQAHCSASFECAMKIALVEPKQGNERYFTCNMCLRSLQGRKELLSHLTKHSNKQYEEMISPARPPPKLKPMAPLPSPKDEASKSSPKSGPYKDGDPAHNHKCDLCGMIYRYRPNLIKHKALCTRLQPEVRTSYKCAHCSMTFLVFKKFHSHVTVNHKKKEFTCAICNSRFRSPSDFLSHHERHRVSAIRQTQHNSDKGPQNALLKERNGGADAKQSKTRAGGQKYTCALCNKAFSTRLELTEHRNLHLKVKIYSCAICRSMFSSAGALEIHMREHGIDDPNERNANISCVEYGSLDEDVRIENDSMNSSAVSSDAQGGYECEQCNRVLSSHANLRRHATIAHRNSKKYECTDCARIFTRKEMYEQHVQHEHKSSKSLFHCPECPKSFVFQTNFRYHFRTAHLEKSRDGYGCDICGKVFAEEASLKIHKGWHNRANSRFNTMLILGKQKNDSQKSAAESNSPERPARARKSFPNPPSQSPTKSPGSFQCQVCNDKFNDVTELRTHLWDVHCARNKPEKSISNDELQCELCTNVFPDKDILAAHMKWHKANPILNDVHKTYTCDVCNKSYSSKKVLWKHKRLHKATLVTSAKFQSLAKKPVNPFFCTICRKPFSSGQSLQRHKLNFHSDLQSQQSRAQSLHNSTRRLSLEEEPKFKRMKVEVDDSPPPPKLPPFAMDFAGEVKKKSFMCHLCRKIFPNMSVLYKHKQAVHKPHVRKNGLPECRPVTTEDGKFLCNVCSKEFPGLPNLRQHFTIKHKKIYDSDKYQCNVSSCDQQAPSEPAKEPYEPTHTNNMMFSCKLCDRYFFNKETMIDHIVNVHNTAYQPDNKTFHWEIDLTTYVVKGATGATCPRCNVKYPNNRAMKIHYVKIHENE
ncbi:PREDICTED: zinc finger protein 836-like isoform X2 [Dinoponera quadriceps]|uniref:Zinc finger protein 836-like isoform X2 n=1 Tax=Dinoponera quadriceps TaxID=609295 RepID=A0A6P3XVR3_DINQU|nr:PREDICTED: zinc finger protein 836-like isoform X2 [Dinoponera quadriceps]